MCAVRETQQRKCVVSALTILAGPEIEGNTNYFWYKINVEVPHLSPQHSRLHTAYSEEERKRLTMGGGVL